MAPLSRSRLGIRLSSMIMARLRRATTPKVPASETRSTRAHQAMRTSQRFVMVSRRSRWRIRSTHGGRGSANPRSCSTCSVVGATRAGVHIGHRPVEEPVAPTSGRSEDQRRIIVNRLLTISIRVNIVLSGTSRRVSEGFHHGEASKARSRFLGLALGRRLGSRRHRGLNFRLKFNEFHWRSTKTSVANSFWAPL